MNTEKFHRYPFPFWYYPGEIEEMEREPIRFRRKKLVLRKATVKRKKKRVKSL